jgi:hypothetical protein
MMDLRLPPSIHKKGILGATAPLGCHRPMDKEHQLPSLKSLSEKTTATEAGR